jgi:hypothetical protein
VINLPDSGGVLYRMASLLRRMGMSGPFDRMWQKGLPSPHLSYFSASNLRQLVEDNSQLRRVADFSLPSVSRKGLATRISGQGIGMPNWLVVSMIWLMSFVLPVLPADIRVGVFEKADRSAP